MNRFLLAKTMNHGDELVWYKRTKTKHLKCTWRLNAAKDCNRSITFVAQHCIFSVDPSGYTQMETDKVHKVFTMYL